MSKEDEDFEATFASLRETFRANLSDYHASLARVRSAFHNSGDDGVRDLKSLAHSLAGSAGTFGFPEIGEVAFEVEAAADAALAREDSREAVIGPLRQLIREIELSL